MEDQLVSFETAKLAKEKGFIEGDHKTIYGELGSLMYDEDGYSPKIYLLAPTQSLLQKWLREKHNLNIGLAYTNCSIGKYWDWRVHYCGLCGNDPTYEQALEAALQEALKLIK